MSEPETTTGAREDALAALYQLVWQMDQDHLARRKNVLMAIEAVSKMMTPEQLMRVALNNAHLLCALEARK